MAPLQDFCIIDTTWSERPLELRPSLIQAMRLIVGVHAVRGGAVLLEVLGLCPLCWGVRSVFPSDSVVVVGTTSDCATLEQLSEPPSCQATVQDGKWSEEIRIVEFPRD